MRISFPISRWAMAVATTLMLSCSVYGQEDKTESTPSEHQLIRTQLGFGYQVNKKYCDKDSFTEAIFEIPEDSEAQRSAYSFNRSLSFVGIKESGTDCANFTNKLAASAGASYDGGAFSGELTAEYEYDENTTSEKSFMMDQRALTLFRVVLQTKKIKAEVKTHLATMPAEQFIRRYGTHYARDLYYGATATLRSSATNTESTKSESIRVSAVASGWGASGSASASSNLNSIESQLRDNITLKVYGGKPGVLTQTNFSDDTFEAWQDTVQSNIGLAAFGSRSLVPIWNLAPNATRKNQLRLAAVKLNPKLESVATKRARLKPYAAKGQIIKLQEAYGKKEYVTDAYNGTDWYFPVLGTYPQKIKMIRTDHGSSGTKELLNGQSVWFWYEGGDVRNWNSNWSKDRWLFVGQNQNAAHWRENGSGSKYEFRIFVKGLDTNSKNVIRDGDIVYIESVAYTNHFLQREQGKFLDANTGGGDLIYFRLKF